MAWIKISDDDGGIYAREAEPDPAEVVSVAELEAEIAQWDEQIAQIQAEIDAMSLSAETPEGLMELAYQAEQLQSALLSAEGYRETAQRKLDEVSA